MLEDDIEVRQGEEDGEETQDRVNLGPPSWIVLVLFALVPIMFATGFSNFERARELVLGIGGAAALMAWGVHVLRLRPISIVAGRVSILLIAFGLYAVAAAAWSPQPMLGILDAVHWLVLAAVFLVIVAPVGRPLSFFDFALATSVGAGVSGLFGVLDLLGLGVFTPIWDPPGAAGAFDAVTFATAYYVVALPITVAAVVRFSGRTRLIFGACFVLAALHFGVVASWTFAAVFGVVALVVALIIAGFQRSQSLLALYPVFALLGVLAIILLAGRLMFDHPTTATDATSLPRLVVAEGGNPQAIKEGRVRQATFAIDRMEEVVGSDAYDYLLGVGLELFREQPIIGHGPAGWWLMQTKYPRADQSYFETRFEVYPIHQSPHSGPLKVLVELGIVGFLLLGLWIIGVLWITVSALTFRSERASWLVEHWALLTAFGAGLAFMFVTPLIELSASSLVWFGAAAMLTRVSAAINDFRDWSSVWSLHSDDIHDPGFKRFLAVGGVAVLLGGAATAPVLLNAASSYHRGFADHLMLRTQYDQAAVVYQRAHDLFPVRGEVLYNIALAHSRQGTVSEAVDFIEEAAAMRPHDARVLHLAAITALRVEQTGLAIEAGRRAVLANPNDMEARRTVAAALQMRGRFEEAAAILSEGLRRDPPPAMRASLHRGLGELYEGPLGQPRQAITHFTQAAELMRPGFARTQLQEKIVELERRLERERLEREGKPVPKHLMPREHDHDHNHPH